MLARSTGDYIRWGGSLATYFKVPTEYSFLTTFYVCQHRMLGISMFMLDVGKGRLLTEQDRSVLWAELNDVYTWLVHVRRKEGLNLLASVFTHYRTTGPTRQTLY